MAMLVLKIWSVGGESGSRMEVVKFVGVGGVEAVEDGMVVGVGGVFEGCGVVLDGGVGFFD